MWSFQLIRSFLCVWLYWPAPTASLSPVSHYLSASTRYTNRAPVQLLLCQVLQMLFTWAFPSVKLSTVSSRSSPSPPCQIFTSVSDHFSSLMLSFSEFRIFPESRLFGLRLHLGRMATVGQSARGDTFSSWHWRLTWTFPLIPRSRVCNVTSPYYYATTITVLAVFLWPKLVWLSLTLVSAFLDGNSVNVSVILPKLWLSEQPCTCGSFLLLRSIIMAATLS